MDENVQYMIQDNGAQNTMQDNVQYMIQNEDGTLQPFLGDPSQIVQSETDGSQVQFVMDSGDGQPQYMQPPGTNTQTQYMVEGGGDHTWQQDGSQIQYVAHDSEIGKTQYVEGIDATSQVQYITEDGQLVQPEQVMESYDQSAMMSTVGDAHSDATPSNVSTDTTLVSSSNNNQSITENDLSMGVMSSFELTQPATDQLETHQYQLPVSTADIDTVPAVNDQSSGISQETIYTDTQSTVQVVDSDASFPHPVPAVDIDASVPHPVQAVDSDASFPHPVQAVDSDASFPQPVQAVDSDASFPHPVQAVESDASLPHPVSSEGNPDEVQYIMDPHSGTIYTLKGGKATVLTTEANIIMDNEDTLNLPTQTAKVVPADALDKSIETPAKSDDISEFKEDLATDATADVHEEQLQQFEGMEENQNKTMDDIVGTSLPVSKEASEILPAIPSVSLTSKAVVNVTTTPTRSTSPKDHTKPVSPNPMRPPSGDMAKLPDVVTSTVTSEETGTSRTVTTSKASTSVQQSVLQAKSPKQQAPPVQRVQQKTIFKCEMCEFRSTNKPDVYQHLLKVHTPSKVATCSKCKKAFKSRMARDSHQSSCELSPLHCPHCSYVTNNKIEMEKHNTCFHSSTSLLCDQCPFEATSEDQLSVHMDKVHGISAAVKAEMKSDVKPGSKLITPSTQFKDSVPSHYSVLSSKTSPGPVMKKIVFSAKPRSRKPELKVKTEYSDEEGNAKKVEINELNQGPGKLKILKKADPAINKIVPFVKKEEHQWESGTKISQPVDLSDSKLKTESKVCLWKLENMVELSEAVKLITQKRLDLTKHIKTVLAKKPHSAKHYATITKKVTPYVITKASGRKPSDRPKNTHYLTQKRDEKGHFLKPTGPKPLMAKSLVSKPMLDNSVSAKPATTKSGMVKPLQKSSKPKMIKTAPRLTDSLFVETREMWEEHMHKEEDAGEGRTKRKRKPKMFGHDFVNSEYLTAEDGLSDRLSGTSSRSASLPSNDSADDFLDNMMEEEEEDNILNPRSRHFKKSPRSEGPEKVSGRSRKKSGSSRYDDDDDFVLKTSPLNKGKSNILWESDMTEEDDYDTPKKSEKSPRSMEDEDYDLMDSEFEPEKKRSPVKPIKHKSLFKSIKKSVKRSRSPSPDSEEEYDELEQLEEMLSRGEEIERVADEAINQAALQNSPVKKSLFLGESFDKFARKRKASIEAVPRAPKQQKKSLDNIRKPAALEKRKASSEEVNDIGGQGDVMVTYNDEGEESGDDEDSREALLRQYAAAVKVTSPQSDGEDDSGKRKRKKKTYGEDFVSAEESPEMKVLMYMKNMKNKRGRPPKGCEGLKLKKAPKMKHTGSKNNPQRGPGPKYSIAVSDQSSATTLPTTGQRRVDGLPSPTITPTTTSQGDTPWMGKLSSILNDVNQGSPQSQMKPVVTGGKNVAYTMIKKGGQMLLVPMSKSATSGSNSQNIISVSKSLSTVTTTTTGSVVNTVSSQGTKKIVIGANSNAKLTTMTHPNSTGKITTLSSIPPGMRVLKVNGKTYLCKNPAVVSPASTIISSKSNDPMTKITSLSSASGSQFPMATKSAVKHTTAPTIVQIPTTAAAQSVKKIASSSSRVVIMPGGKNIAIAPKKAGQTVLMNKNPLQQQQRGPFVIQTTPTSVNQSMTLFPANNENAGIPSSSSSSAHLITRSLLTSPKIVTNAPATASSVEISSTSANLASISSSSQQSSHTDATELSLNPQDLLRNMVFVGEDGSVMEDDMDPLAQDMDSTAMLDPQMEEMLNLL